MKIVYIAHPIAGDVIGNLKKILEIVRHINLTEPDIVPLVPYYTDCVALDDSNPVERERGRKNGLAMILQKRVDEVWCYGGTISPGMEAEIDAADKMGLPVRVCGYLLPKEDAELGLMVSNTAFSVLPNDCIDGWETHFYCKHEDKCNMCRISD